MVIRLKKDMKDKQKLYKEIVLERKIVTYDELSDKLYINSSVIHKDMVNLKQFQNDLL